MKRFSIRRTCILLLAALASTVSQAGLSGDVITATWQYEEFVDINSFTVGPGVELIEGFTNSTLNATDSFIAVRSNKATNGIRKGVQWIFSDLDFGAPFTVEVTTNFQGFNASDISVTDTSFAWTLSNDVSYRTGTGFIFFHLIQTPTVAAVPELPPAYLLLIGTLVLWAFGYSKNKLPYRPLKT